MCVMNTIALEGALHSSDTWVELIAAGDIGTIITHTTKAKQTLQKMIQARLTSIE